MPQLCLILLETNLIIIRENNRITEQREQQNNRTTEQIHLYGVGEH